MESATAQSRSHCAVRDVGGPHGRGSAGWYSAVVVLLRSLLAQCTRNYSMRAFSYGSSSEDGYRMIRGEGELERTPHCETKAAGLEGSGAVAAGMFANAKLDGTPTFPIYTILPLQWSSDSTCTPTGSIKPSMQCPQCRTPFGEEQSPRLMQTATWIQLPLSVLAESCSHLVD